MDYTTTIKMVRHDGPLTVLSLENETGTAEMNNWEVYPGITLSYLEAHMEEFSCYAPLRPDVFAINHCEEGRIECRFKNGEYLYMGKGDMSVGRRSCSDYCHMAYFPSSHYHGLSVLVDEKGPSPSWTACWNRRASPWCPCATAFAAIPISASSFRKTRP